MADFQWAIDLATELITDNGEASFLVRTLGGSPDDSSKPWIPGTPTVTRTTVRAVYLKESILRRPSLAKDQANYVIMAIGKKPDPSTDHLERANGERFSVKEVEPLNPAGDEILYELTVEA